MSTLLEELLNEVEENETNQQLKIICDKIFEEEKDKMEDIEYVPTGPTILLAIRIQVKNKKEKQFLCLEWENIDDYIAGVYKSVKKEDGSITQTRLKTIYLKKSKPKEIIKEFANVLKRYKR